MLLLNKQFNAVHYNFAHLHPLGHPVMETEDLSDSELDKDASQASDPAPLDPSDKAMICRGTERAQVPFRQYQ